MVQAFADVIPGGGQNWIPSQILSDPVQRSDAAGNTDGAQDDACTPGFGGECPSEDHHGGLRQGTVLAPVGAVERERRVGAERGGKGERTEREHYQNHDEGAPHG